MTVALMWEARALPGRSADLLAWTEERTRELTRRPLRRESFRAPGTASWSSPGGTPRTTPTSPNSRNRTAT
ncbi:hypothetical protein SHKM778_09480 [Streptomyces sp. KM77-8]|uniref:Uncharacterized protein n=1 Tax=Streptomyces haneummycinicus TaxID=3074435 RepID=A0AAT9HB01_9ACTN